MKKKIQALCASFFMGILFLMVGIPILAEPSYETKFSDWGNLLKQYANDENGNEMIYARGKNGVITNKEVEQAIAFYDTFGMSAEEARKQAILYVEEREALYQQAIEAGYTVTDKEVYDYLEELKQFINQSENKEDAMAIIEQFDSEEDYWNYEFEVYKKDLPIQKYMAAKEKEFKEVAPQAKSINEIEEEWQDYYEQIKAQAVENEEFKVVEYLEGIIDLMHKVQMAYNANLKDLMDKGMLPLFDAGYINIKRQYLTIGVNGMVEAAESLGITISDNKEYEEFVGNILGLIEDYNHKYRSKEVMFNCEMIPAENVGVKHARWDREDGYYVPRDCYNSYFYVVEDTNTDIIEKFRLHGRRFIEHLTGGSALHMNLDEHLSQPQYRQLLRVAAKEGCNYFTFNIPNTLCNDCGHIDKHHLHTCPKCGSTNLDYLTRIIGYLKRVSNFSLDRQKEAGRRYYQKIEA